MTIGKTIALTRWTLTSPRWPPLIPRIPVLDEGSGHQQLFKGKLVSFFSEGSGSSYCLEVARPISGLGIELFGKIANRLRNF